MVLDHEHDYGPFRPNGTRPCTIGTCTAVSYDSDDDSDFLSEDEARRIASEWHGGQWSPLYMFASSGATSDSRYSVEDIIAECRENLDAATAIGPAIRWELGALIEYLGQFS